MSSLSKGFAVNEYQPVFDRLDQLLDTVGDGTGTTEQATTAEEYIFKPSAGVVAVIERLLVGFEDGSKFSADKYGGITALSNGILITLKDSSDAIIHTFTPNPIKKTWHWGLVAGSDVTPSDYATGNDRVLVRFTFSKGGSPFIINGDAGEYLSVDIRDDLSGLVSHIMTVQGYKAI